jgi:hypothetical protein
MELNSGKSAKRGAESAKHKCPYNKCKTLHHCAAECPQKQQHAGDKGGKSAIKKNVEDFVAHIMEAFRAKCVDADSCYCDSGASRYINRTNSILSHAKLSIPGTCDYWCS